MLAQQAFYHLSHTSSPFSSSYFWRWDFVKHLLVLASNLNPPNLNLSGSFRIVGVNH
jgi:hypothetical protein